MIIRINPIKHIRDLITLSSSTNNEARFQELCVCMSSNLDEMLSGNEIEIVEFERFSPEHIELENLKRKLSLSAQRSKLLSKVPVNVMKFYLLLMFGTDSLETLESIMEGGVV